MLRRGVPVRVLMVDDEIDFLASMARMLDRRGIEVLVAPSAVEALARLRWERVDVAVLDVRMPGMDGESLFERLRMEYPELPVLVLTGHGTVDQAFRMSRAGVFAYLPKPCGVADLVGKILEAAPDPEAPGTGMEVSGHEDLVENATRALLVDDESEFAESIARVLGRRGIRAEIAGSGAAALRKVAATDFDVVVLDVRLPDADGLEILGRIRRERPDTEVILLTGYPSFTGAVRGIRDGAFDYLVKPPSAEELVHCIRRAARQRVEARRRAERSIAGRVASGFAD
jgi:DNA-binding NtrC family response regulator